MGSAVGTLGFLREAIEEREAANSALALDLAVHQVMAADRVISAGGSRSEFTHLAGAVTALDGDHRLALHAMSAASATQAERLIAETRVLGGDILAGRRSSVSSNSPDDLVDLLHGVAERASRKGTTAERIALVFALLGAIAATLAGWLLIRSRATEFRLRDELTHQATTDILTGLPNRRVLDRVLDRARTDMATSGGVTGIVLLDLDGFKNVNDTFGHRTGDRLLVEVAARLRRAQRAHDVLLRLGGDEFAVVLVGMPTADGAEQAAHRYLSVVDEGVEVDDRSEHLRASVGVATTDDPAALDTLAAEADLAMYEAKRAGGHRVVVFQSGMEHNATAVNRITRALRLADFDQEFSLHFQPIVSIDAREPVSYEALLRWESAEIGPVGPAEFIPVAEQIGEICAIGRWVLNRVCAQLHDWDREGRWPDLRISCNVSPLQLEDPNFVLEVTSIVDGWGVDRRRVVLEVTESTVLDAHGAAVARLAALRDAGFRVAIDDFGSGYSNLGQLLQVPFDMIKIDRSLLVTLSEMREHAGGDPTSPCAIMTAIVSIASVFEAPVVCEGVETEDQLRSLRASGITHVQGYLTGRPLPAAEAFGGSSQSRERPAGVPNRARQLPATAA
ncbi:MAG: EAL domain-containing protein [Thermoleophilia bacterium]|nr:EAL domain-containing protein [Thermoleophilia bacterium]